MAVTSDFYPARGTFLPGEPVCFVLENGSGADCAELWIFLPDGSARREMHPLQAGRNTVALSFCPETLSGFGAKAVLYAGEEAQQALATAFDVMPAGKRIRYGFLSDFSADEAEDAQDVEWMCRLHINAVQFYDWSYRHDCLVAPAESYQDMMGKHNSLCTIRRKIAACHEHGMRAVAYGAVYAASRAYQEQAPEQGLYDNRGAPLRFIDVFSLMNLAPGGGWFSHILGEYRRAITQVGFDGIHMDTYGEPKFAFDSAGSLVRLDEQFPPLIDAAWDMACRETPQPCMIFNHVGGWPLAATAGTRQSGTYLEIWPPNEHYWQLAALIGQAKAAGRPVVLAAYPAAFRTQAPAAALEGELLLSFVIAMHGASQLCFGENRGVITQGYYADYARLSEEACRLVRAYQDFFVQYETLLADDSFQDVSLTHQGWDNREYRCNTDCSAWGEGGKLWLHICENRSTKLLCFVNLTGGDDRWNAGRQRPEALEGVKVAFLAEKAVKSIWYATPDADFGQRRALPGTACQTPDGLQWEVELPRLLRCGMLVAEMEQGTGEGRRFPGDPAF